MTIKLIVGACAIALAQLAACEAAAQSPDLQSIRQELESVRAAQMQMQEEMRQMKALIQKLSAPAVVAASAPALGTELSLEGAQVKGAAQAKVVLIEYSDFQCPFCASYAASSYREISRDYVDTGKARYAFMSFPIESLHPAAFRQHIAAACAAEGGRFWPMHDRLFADPKAVDARALAAHAAAIGLDGAKFRSCLEVEGHAAEIRRTVASGHALGINGTPTFVIGIVGADEKVKVARVISGAKPYAAFKEAIDGVLATTMTWHDDSVPSRPAVTSSVPSTARDHEAGLVLVSAVR